MAESVFSLKKGLTEILVLRVLLEKEMYGYEIVKAIADRSADRFSVTEAALYTTLYKMESDKLVSSDEVMVGSRRRRRYYKLTAKGREYAMEEIQKYLKMTDGIRGIMDGWKDVKPGKSSKADAKV